MARQPQDEKLESLYNKVEEYRGKSPATTNHFQDLLKPHRNLEEYFLTGLYPEMARLQDGEHLLGITRNSICLLG